MKLTEICQNGEALSLTTEDGLLRLVFIGVGAAFSKRNRQANILVIQGDHHCLVDCGTQGPLALNDVGLDVVKVNCYLPTHSHADHIGGLEEVALVNRYLCHGTKNPKLIILKDYQDLLWNKSLSGGMEYCEVNQGEALQMEDFFDIRRPKAMVFDGFQCWTYQHGPLEIMLMRTRHFPDSAGSPEESQWCSGVFINRRVWISGDTMFDAHYPLHFAKSAEVMFHDCQLFKGGVHGSYQELITLPAEVRAKIFLYHYGDNWDRPETWAKDLHGFSGDPVKDGFLGWTRPQIAYDFD
ncbi:MAG: MBL fold metallo-hydrolase [Nitrospinales bacterium]